jgi:hypothetical protein
MASVVSPSLREQAHRVQWFLVVQFIALVGWIIVQTTFTLSPLHNNIPFPVTMVIEAIWWIATLAIMFWLFKRVYDRFVKSALDLEEANSRLRKTTNQILSELRNPNEQ